MNTKVLLLCSVASALVVCAQADTVITDNPSKISVAASTTFSASTAKQTDYPSGLPTPIFWFDARQTNGWVFSGQTVTKIPSLVGDRYLTTDQTVGHFRSWTVTGATYVDSVADLTARQPVRHPRVVHERSRVHRRQKQRPLPDVLHLRLNLDLVYLHLNAALHGRH